MGWTISSDTPGYTPTIDSNGKATFPVNEGTSNVICTITYTDANGCIGSTTYTVGTGCTPSPCDCTTALTLSTTGVDIPGTETGITAVSYTASCGVVTVESDDAWITATVDTNFVNIQYDKNYPAFNKDRTGYVKVKLDNKDCKTITVNQSHVPTLLFTSHDTNLYDSNHNLLANAGDEIKVPIGWDWASYHPYIKKSETYKNLSFSFKLEYGTSGRLYCDFGPYPIIMKDGVREDGYLFDGDAQVQFGIGGSSSQEWLYLEETAGDHAICPGYNSFAYTDNRVFNGNDIGLAYGITEDDVTIEMYANYNFSQIPLYAFYTEGVCECGGYSSDGGRDRNGDPGRIENLNFLISIENF